MKHKYPAKTSLPATQTALMEERTEENAVESEIMEENSGLDRNSEKEQESSNQERKAPYIEQHFKEELESMERNLGQETMDQRSSGQKRKRSEDTIDQKSFNGMKKLDTKEIVEHKDKERRNYEDFATNSRFQPVVRLSRLPSSYTQHTSKKPIIIEPIINETQNKEPIVIDDDNDDDEMACGKYN